MLSDELNSQACAGGVLRMKQREDNRTFFYEVVDNNGMLLFSEKKVCGCFISLLKKLGGRMTVILYEKGCGKNDCEFIRRICDH